MKAHQQSTSVQAHNTQHSFVIQPASMFLIHVLIICAVVVACVVYASVDIFLCVLGALLSIGFFGHKLFLTEQGVMYEVSFLKTFLRRQFDWRDVQRVIYERDNKRKVGETRQDGTLVFYFLNDKKSHISLNSMQTPQIDKLLSTIETFTQANEIPFEELAEKPSVAIMIWVLIMVMVFGFCFYMFYVLHESTIHLMSPMTIILSIVAMWLLPYLFYWFWQKWRLAPEQLFSLESQSTVLLVSGLLVIGFTLFANRFVTEKYAPRTTQTFHLIKLSESAQTWQSIENPALKFDIENSKSLAISSPNVGDKHTFVLADGWLGDYAVISRD